MGEPAYWEMPYLPIDPADLGQTYEAVIRVNSQSGKGGIAYIVKQHLHLDLPRKMQIAFYKVVQEISDREAREMTVEDITTAFRRTYHFGGLKYGGRLALRNFKISADPATPNALDDTTDDEHRRFDGTISVDGVYRVIRGDGNGPLSALLDALRTHLDIDYTIREYTEHAVGEGKEVKAASYVEIVPENDYKSSKSWWGAGLDTDIAASGLRAVLSAVNSAIGDQALPELRLRVGFNNKSGQDDLAGVIVNSLGLELPRRLQASFFEVVQRAARDRGGNISVNDVTDLFITTYAFNSPIAKLALGEHNMADEGNGRRRFTGIISFSGQDRRVSGAGNGPLSAALASLHSQIRGSIAIKEYSEHSVGEGTDVVAASFVELVYEVPDSGKKSAWGIATDTDITVSGIKACLSAASQLDLVYSA